MQANKIAKHIHPHNAYANIELIAKKWQLTQLKKMLNYFCLELIFLQRKPKYFFYFSFLFINSKSHVSVLLLCFYFYFLYIFPLTFIRQFRLIRHSLGVLQLTKESRPGAPSLDLQVKELSFLLNLIPLSLSARFPKTNTSDSR